MNLSREQIRARIDALECWSDVNEAAEAVNEVEWGPHEAKELDIQITTRSDCKGVAFVHNIPPSVLLAGLRAMERALAEVAGMEVAA